MNDWSNAYESWTGDFQALVETSNQILKAMNPSVEEVSASLVRHYQAKDLVGRGIRQGRQSQFTVDDLRAVVETKCMAKDGWGLDKVAQIYRNSGYVSDALNNSSLPTKAMEVVSSLMKRSVSTASSPTSTQTSGLSSPIFNNLNGGVLKSPLSNNEPQVFCASTQSSMPPTLEQSSSPKLRGFSNVEAIAGMGVESSSLSFANILSASQSTSTLRQEMKPAAWLTVYIDPRLMNQASEQDIENIFNQLKEACKTQQAISKESR